MRSFFHTIAKTALLTLSVTAYAANSPVGLWETVDDATGKPKSIIKITELKNHTLEGKVVKLYEHPDRLCTACHGDRKNQPIQGMVVITGIKLTDPANHLWSDGEILDPKNGKTYHCNMQVINNGSNLQVRGFIGVALFGRNQVWNEISDQK